MDLTHVILTLIVYAIGLGLAYWLLSLLPLPHPFPTILLVLFVLLGLLLLWDVFTGSLGLPRLR